MQAKEFQIGDWVNWHTYTNKPHFCRLTILQSDTILDCEPIRITPEILEKNDFEYHKGEWSLVRKGFLFSISVFVEEGWYCTGGFGTQIIIKYVHELQHALRLCGLNELADNFKVD